MKISIAGQRPTRGRLTRLLIASALLIALTAISAAVHVDAYAITPGSATAIGPRMTLTPPVPRTRGQVAMVDLNISQMTVLSRFLADLKDSPRYLPGSAFGFSGTAGLEKYFLQSYLTMDQAKHDAVIAAFRAAKRPIDEMVTGLLIYDATAKSSVKLGDFLEAVNGHRVETPCGLAIALAGQGPFTATIRRGHMNPNTGALRFGSKRTIVLKHTEQHRLVAYRGSVCSAAPTTDVGILSVNPAHLEKTTPRVSITTSQIGGPSAGFAIALSLVDRLEHGQMLHGRSVAATGTIDAVGNVGDVGGVPEKAVAVGAARFGFFFVPEAEVAAAKSAAPSSVRIIGVRSLAEAITALKSP